jgi:hypothetical protein
MMLTGASRLLFAALLLSYLTCAIAFWEEIRCTKSSNPGRTKDCEGALDLVPYGPYFDPSKPGDIERPDKPFDLHLGYPWRSRTKISLPAVFLSGSCLILIQRVPSSISVGPLTPKRAASAMYFYVWPKIRELVPKIVKECPLEGGDNMGLTIARIKLETEGKFKDLYAGYLVSVRAAPKAIVRLGSKAKIGSSRILYNVYESSETIGDKDGSL